jgi:hypothetical protein
VRLIDDVGLEVPRLSLPPQNGLSRSEYAPPNTWLSWIRMYVQPIRHDFLWSEEEAVRFLLVGQAPPIHPVAAHVQRAHDGKGGPLRVQISMTVQPFVSMETLDRAMAVCRYSLGRRLRLGPPLAPRTLAVFEFVETEKMKEGWQEIPWSRLVARWDKSERAKRRKWTYKNDRGNFRRDYQRARQLLMYEYMDYRDRAELRAQARG